MRDQFPYSHINSLIKIHIIPVRKLAGEFHQEIELRNRDQREGRRQRDGNPLQTHLQPLLRVIALIQHIRKIARDNKEHLHTEGVNNIIKYCQAVRGYCTVYRPDMTGVNQ
ncbi:hypothetical protein SRABI106_03905 [Rahnella aquatilis]|nr:hypothetical protein SRABI106_03905 [Rahnella aquatilis]